MRTNVLILMATLALCTFAPLEAGEASPWPTPVPGFVAPGTGEHPRLFFRQSDLPALRKKAETPEGKAILIRLRALLGQNGEAMPTAFQESTEAYQDKSKDLPVGAYTLWHGAGYGLLWQLTQDKKYADLGRQCVEKAFAGQRDRDDRYSWVSPGGFLRAGPSVGAIAMAYDLCFDGWDEAFRQKVANALLKYDGGHTARDGGGQQTMEKMATAPHMPPFSNHFAPQVGGVTLALLAIKGDPEVDQALVEKYLAATEKNTLTALTGGWGDHGQYAEGDGPGSISSDTVFVPALQAWRIAGGKDFITPRPDAAWMTLKWVMQTLPSANGFPKSNAWVKAQADEKILDAANGWPAYPLRGNYPQNVWSRLGSSGSGTIAQGLGAIPDEFKPALLWTHNHCVGPKNPDYDAVGYPQRAVLSFINWPVGLQERNPGDLLPKLVADAKWGLFMFRNRWQDEDDIVISALPKGHKGYHAVKGGDVILWGLGKRITLPPGSFAGQYTSYLAGAAGGVATTAESSLGVDFSKLSGAEGLVVISGRGASMIKPSTSGPVVIRATKIGGVDAAVITLTN